MLSVCTVVCCTFSVVCSDLECILCAMLFLFCAVMCHALSEIFCAVQCCAVPVVLGLVAPASGYTIKNVSVSLVPYWVDIKGDLYTFLKT